MSASCDEIATRVEEVFARAEEVARMADQLRVTVARPSFDSKAEIMQPEEERQAIASRAHLVEGPPLLQRREKRSRQAFRRKEKPLPTKRERVIIYARTRLPSPNRTAASSRPTAR